MAPATRSQKKSATTKVAESNNTSDIQQVAVTIQSTTSEASDNMSQDSVLSDFNNITTSSTSLATVDKVPKCTANNTQVSFNIQPFDGNPAFLNFFFEQLNDLARCNNWSEDHTISYFKSKLSGNALQFYIDSPHLKTFTTFDEVQQAFNEFFTPMSATTSTSPLTNFTMLEGESISSVVHRLNSITSKLYGDLKDPAFLERLRFIQFKDAMPTEVKFIFAEESIASYQDAISRALKWQKSRLASGQSMLPSTSSTNTTAANVNTVFLKPSKVESTSLVCQLCNANSHSAQDCPTLIALKANQADNMSVGDFSHQSSGSNFQSYRQHPYAHAHRRNFHNRPRQFHNYGSADIVTCQFCNKKGHVLNDCFAFQRQQNQVSQNQQYNYGEQRNAPRKFSNHGPRNQSKSNTRGNQFNHRGGYNSRFQSNSQKTRNNRPLNSRTRP